MAYSDLPKLADIQKAVTAATNANKAYNDALAKTKPSETALKDAEKARAEAEKKLREIQAAYDSGAYLKSNSGYTSAVSAFNTAEKKLNDLIKYKDSEQYLKDNTAYKNAVTAMQEAEKKLNQFRDYKDSGGYVRDNAGYKTALNNVSNAENKRNDAQRAVDNANDKDRPGLEKALNTANTNLDKANQALDRARETAEKAAETNLQNLDKAFATAETTVNKSRETAERTAQTNIDTADKARNTAQTALDKARDAADTAYQKNQIQVAQTTYDKSSTAYDKANDTLQSLKDSMGGLSDQRQDRYNDVAGYAQSLKENLGGITKQSELTLANKLISDFQSLVDKTDIGDFEKQVLPMFKDVDASKLSSVPKLNAGFKNTNPDNFSNIDPNTGLPILNQEALDRVLNKYGDNNLNSGQYRDNYNAFGWNIKSDGSSVSRGPAVLGLDMGTISTGMSGGYKGIVKSGTNTAATDDDLKKAAEQVSLDFNSYIKPSKFVPSTGSYGATEQAHSRNSKEYTDPVTGETYLARIDAKGNFTNSLDKTALYNDIADKTKDFYVVANALEAPGANKPAEHAAVIFKADGSGNLVPVVDQDGKVAASYYKTSTVTHAGWRGQLAELAPLISVASAIFLPGVGSALAQSIGNATIGTAAAVAPTAFTVGLPATSISLGSVIGATGVNALTGAIINGGMAFLTNGDVGKAMLAGAAGGAASASASDVANTVMGGGQTGINNVASIAKVANLSVSQVEKIIASGVASGLTSAVTDPDNALKNMAISIASNFTSEEAKNIVSGSVDPKSVNGLTTFVSNAVDLGTSAAINGQDVGKVLQNAAPALASGAAQAQSKYVTPVNVSSGASGFPVQERLQTYYKDLLASGFDEDVTAQIKKIYPNISDADAQYMAKSFVGKVASDQFGVPFAEADIGGKLPPVEVTAKAEPTIFDKISRGFSTAFNLSEITDPNAPSNGKSALLNIGAGQGSAGGKSDSWFELVGFTSNGNPVYSASGEKGGSGALFTLFTVDGKPQLVDENKNITWITPEAQKKLEDIAVNVKQEVKVNNADERIINPDTFEIIKEPAAKTNALDDWFESYYKQQSEAPQYTAGDALKEINKDLPVLLEQAKEQDPLKAGLFSQYAKDPSVMRQYVDEAYKYSYYSGMPLNTANISKTALGLLQGDMDKMFANAGSGTTGGSTTSSTTGGGQTVGGGTSTSGTDAGGGAGGTGGGNATSGIGAGVGTGTGGGGTGGTGTGTGGDGGAAAAAEKATAEKTAAAGRKATYNQMMGIGSLPQGYTEGKTLQATPANVFYYGKEFGSPTQEISKTGELIQEPYRPLSVVQPGKELAPTNRTGENDVSNLLNSILSKDEEEVGLNDLLGIIGGSQYGI